VVLTGVIERMNGSQWIIDGQTVNIDSATQEDGLKLVGETVKVEALVAGNGSLTAQSVQGLSSEESTSAKSEASSLHDSQESGDDMEAIGLVEAMTGTSITIGGQVYNLVPGAEIKDGIATGALAKVHFIVNTDGTRSITEAEPSDLTLTEDNNQGEDHSSVLNRNSSPDDRSYDDDSDHDSEHSTSDDDHEDEHSSDASHTSSDDANTSGSGYSDD
jgi:hypothetical protein